MWCYFQQLTFSSSFFWNSPFYIDNPGSRWQLSTFRRHSFGKRKLNLLLIRFLLSCWLFHNLLLLLYNCWKWLFLKDTIHHLRVLVRKSWHIVLDMQHQESQATNGNKYISFEYKSGVDNGRNASSSEHDSQ